MKNAYLMCGGHGQARERVHELGVLDAVDVGERRLELRDAVQDLQELGSFIFGWL